MICNKCIVIITAHVTKQAKVMFSKTSVCPMRWEVMPNASWDRSHGQRGAGGPVLGRGHHLPPALPGSEVNHHPSNPLRSTTYPWGQMSTTSPQVRGQPPPPGSEVNHLPPPPGYIRNYGQWVGGTHPTGTHS